MRVDDISADTFADAASAVARVADSVLKGRQAAALSDRDIAVALGAAARLYAAKADSTGVSPPPIDGVPLTATETVTLVSALLRMADLNVFDLAMWFRRAP